MLQRSDHDVVPGLPPTLRWDDDGPALVLLDQTRLPGEVAFRRCTTADDVIRAIRELAVRGAPAIGVAGAYGVCLGSREQGAGSREQASDEATKRRSDGGQGAGHRAQGTGARGGASDEATKRRSDGGRRRGTPPAFDTPHAPFDEPQAFGGVGSPPSHEGQPGAAGSHDSRGRLSPEAEAHASSRTPAVDAFLRRVREVAERVAAARPTAVNLRWAVDRVVSVAHRCDLAEPAQIWQRMLVEAHAIRDEDAELCRRIGEHGAALIRDGMRVLTHCNAGALATVAWGTATAVMYAAHLRGVRFEVFADETRPLLQGARLTAFELTAAGIPTTVLCDSAACALMAAGKVDLVIVGADRIAANGDVANKIGTYMLAVAAKHHGVPFYVAAPYSTFDLACESGAAIPIEQRSEDELRRGVPGPVVPDAVAVWNPAFDVTPAALITGIITDRGIIRPVTSARIAEVLAIRPTA